MYNIPVQAAPTVCEGPGTQGGRLRAWRVPSKHLPGGVSRCSCGYQEGPTSRAPLTPRLGPWTRTWPRAAPRKPGPHGSVAAPPLSPFGVEEAVICPLGVADGRLAWKGKQHHLELVPGERSRQHLPLDASWSRVSVESLLHWGGGAGRRGTEAGTAQAGPQDGRPAATGRSSGQASAEARPLRGPPAAPSPTCRSPAAVQDGHPGPWGGVWEGVGEQMLG